MPLPEAFFGADVSRGNDVHVGAFAVIGAMARLGDGCRIGAHAVIHPGTVLADGCEVQDHAVLGKPPKLASHSTAVRELPPPLEVGAGAVICCGAIVFAGAAVGVGAIIGDQSYVRERAVIGEGTVIGRGSTVDNDVWIGTRVRVQTDVYVTAYSILEDDAFVGPGVLMTNDQTMARHGADYQLQGPRLRRACRVGGAALLLPGVEIGEEAFVAAGAVVTTDVPPRTLVMGSPARVVREVPEAELLEHWR